ncbi:MAG: hypothetical protein LBH18_03345 [Spirochaetaceae bacterium]|jgi:hypothetical protein|nr:hypothetical protein [Spirochaetaceae bacterium]
MGNDIIQITSAEDGCIYIVDGDTKKVRRLCDVETRADIPASVSRILAKFNIKVNFDGKAAEKE